MSEKKSLKMHNNLLLDVIKRQAGTLNKAFLEGVMNGLEAGASQVNVTFKVEDGKAYATLKDNGKGISSIEEIESFFETFGTPHDESENKIWAQFRMGRGQLFSFGKNTWRTSHFKMMVDIKEWGLSYQLEQNHEEINGCEIEIELYENPIGTWNCPSLDSLKEAVKKLCKFMEGNITFNKDTINTPASTLKWDIEDENAYYSFNSGINVGIYNLGAYVMDIASSRAGTNGIIVSKKQLKVNFARNDVLYNCPIYTSIQEVIKQNRIKKTRKKGKRLSQYERQSVLTDLRDGTQFFKNVKHIKIVKTSQGKYMSLKEIIDNKQEWVFAPLGSNIADKAMQMGIALCFDESIIDELGFNGDNDKFFTWISNVPSYDYPDIIALEKRYLAYNSYESKDNCFLTDKFESGYKTLGNKDLTKLERRFLKVLNDMTCYFKNREIRIGVSGESSAWTDGRSYITLERDFIKSNVNYNEHHLFVVLIHELAHDDDTDCTHYHGPEFYENFHEISLDMHSSPLKLINSFKSKIKNAIQKENYEKQEKRVKKAEQKQKEKLGI